MIIDLILNRKDGQGYTPKHLYSELTGWAELGAPIAEAMDSGTEHEVKRELCRYVIEQDYSLNIINFILSVDWL